MSVKHISSAILGVGVDDTTIDLFESQYPVPTGVSYNSYVIRSGWRTSPRHWTAASRSILLSPTWSRTTVLTLQSWRPFTRR